MTLSFRQQGQYCNVCLPVRVIASERSERGNPELCGSTEIGIATLSGSIALLFTMTTISYLPYAQA